MGIPLVGSSRLDAAISCITYSATVGSGVEGVTVTVVEECSSSMVGFEFKLHLIGFYSRLTPVSSVRRSSLGPACDSYNHYNLT